jgi:hypothetical protein
MEDMKAEGTQVITYWKLNHKQAQLWGVNMYKVGQKRKTTIFKYSTTTEVIHTWKDKL